MGATYSMVSEVCNCGSPNDYVETQNLPKNRKLRNMSPKLPVNNNMPSNSISHQFNYESISASNIIPLDSKTIDMIVNLDNVDSISTQNLLKISATADRLDAPITQLITDNELEEKTSYRIQQISLANNITELQTILSQNYSPTSANTSLSNMRASCSKANIYRDGTDTPWTDNNIDILTHEMHEQLFNLINHDQFEIIQPMDCSSDDDDNIPSSNLYSDASNEKWSNKVMDIKRKEMKQEMLHLALSQSKSIEKNNNVQYLGIKRTHNE